MKKPDIWCFFVLFGTDFADKIVGYGLDDARRTNGICDFLQKKFVMEKKYDDIGGVSMATRFQHYVPQVYLRAWETTKGVYYFSKSDLSVGERRNTYSILAKNHTYTIDYEYSFVFNEMPLLPQSRCLPFLMYL